MKASRASIASRKQSFFSSSLAEKAFSSKIGAWTADAMRAASQLRQSRVNADKEHAKLSRLTLAYNEWRDKPPGKTDVDVAKRLSDTKAWQQLLASNEKRVAAAEKEVEEKLATVRKLENEIEKPIPIMNEYEVKLEAPKVSESRTKDGIRVQGREYISTITTVGGSPAGSPIFGLPLSPAFWGGNRLADLAQLYDLYRVHSLAVVYVPMCASTDRGSIVGTSTGDINEDTGLFLTGDAAIRDAEERPGAQIVPIFTPAAFGINVPQQMTYFTSNSDVPNLSALGMFSMLTTVATSSLTLGSVEVHYDIEFLSESSARSSALTVASLADGTITWPTMGLVAKLAFQINVSGWNPFSGLSNGGQGWIGELVICSPGVNPLSYTGFASLLYGDGSRSITIATGTRLWFRMDKSGTFIVFFPSFGEAELGHIVSGDASSPGNCLVNSATNNIATTFPTIAFTACRMFQLPESVQ